MLGTQEDFQELINLLHQEQMHLVLDGVFSHVGKNSLYFNISGDYGDDEGAAKILTLILTGSSLKIILLIINLGGELKIYLKLIKIMSPFVILFMVGKTLFYQSGMTWE